ncbi:MAG: glucose-6-phosphate dehydrogenase (NADP(+)), partial [Gammaproteobacteria bacterium]|nr:glucose-6-phosphate dehydrogenase (NADP(+)) [Gammaproteobacteria bacterium]
MANFVPVDVFDLVIFGGTGDLAMRKLLPALYHRERDGQITGDSRVIAASRGDLGRDEYLGLVEQALQDNLGSGDFDDAEWAKLRDRIHYVQSDAYDHDNWGALVDLLADGEDRIRVAYLATAPSLFGTIAQGLKKNGLISSNSRIVLEKPLGHDYESACTINNEVGDCFAENQIYRIDHYLGKETVQNLLALRFANSLFEPLWRRGAIDHVQITVAEDLGVGGRIEYFDKIGSLRDMVQNHLLQLVCLVAMEAPSSLHHDAVRDEKIKVLRALRPINEEAVRTSTVRGQYT